MRRPLLVLFAASALAACGRDASTGGSAVNSVVARTDTSGRCDGICDASGPTVPVLSDSGGWGDVTTYGGVGNSAPSSGGACNYGSTGIVRYAAIQVDSLPGDGRGQWQGGAVCGQCVEIRARTDSGWKTTWARIVDKCPDAHCGIDLGGLPATDLMGAQAGRYSGGWRFVSCAGLDGVADGAPSLHVKDGSSQWWSRVQVRNPDAAVRILRMRPAAGGAWDTLARAVEAENFLVVPDSVFADTAASWDLEARTRGGAVHFLRVRAAELSRAGNDLAMDSTVRP